MVMGKIHCVTSELNLVFTLSGGQSFRWRETRDKKWVGVFEHRIWILHQNEDTLFYQIIENSELLKENGRDTELVEDKTITAVNHRDEVCLLKKYFRLSDLNLKEAYADWSKHDTHFKSVSESFQGIRILNQDPVENLFSFICSSNNNISRISTMVKNMCILFGKKIATVNGETLHDFPNISSLAKPEVENQLRSAGFGYRARFIYESAVKLVELGGYEWLENLKNLSYESARKELMILPGIGSKVADCICLMSLGFLESVPVDTHIFQVAAKWYLPHLCNSKSVTPRIHQEIGDFFRNLYGPYAGWAHTILFCGNLKKFEESTEAPSKPKRKKKTISV